jgi:AraC-like DNA-binding protein
VAQYDIPEGAIETFERIHRLNVTVHDLTGNLSPFLKPYRFHHRSALCLAVKAQGHSATCLQFELKLLRNDLAQQSEGRVHVCHAGLVEWAVPVFERGKLCWILFAGPRQSGRKLASAVRTQPTRFLKSPWSKRLALPAPVEEDEAHLILEHLCQLAARLQKWAQELAPHRSAENRASEFQSDLMTTRQTVVRRFVEDEYAGPATLPMLAQKLGLSESRASHVVHACCGANFRELMIQKRLTVAMELLRQSGMSVLEVALASGFEDVAHFHRLFRRRIGTTPGQYRVSGRS